MGCDWGILANIKDTQDFNPRTRMGCDMKLVTETHAKANFNPRTRMGCDPKNDGTSNQERSFQSTHPYGVRLEFGLSNVHVAIISIHAPVWGATSKDN